MRGDGKDKHKVCLRASTPYIPIWPDLPSRSRTLSIPSFSHICMSAFVHTICSNWVRPCCRMFSQRKEMAAICISGSASRNPLNPATHTHIPHTHTEIRARMLIQSQTINLRAGRILKRLIQYGRRFTIQTLANARSESVRSPRVRISVRPAVYPSVFV